MVATARPRLALSMPASARSQRESLVAYTTQLFEPSLLLQLRPRTRRLRLDRALAAGADPSAPPQLAARAPSWSIRAGGSGSLPVWSSSRSLLTGCAAASRRCRCEAPCDPTRRRCSHRRGRCAIVNSITPRHRDAKAGPRRRDRTGVHRPDRGRASASAHTGCPRTHQPYGAHRPAMSEHPRPGCAPSCPTRSLTCSSSSPLRSLPSLRTLAFTMQLSAMCESLRRHARRPGHRSLRASCDRSAAALTRFHLPAEATTGPALTASGVEQQHVNNRHTDRRALPPGRHEHLGHGATSPASRGSRACPGRRRGQGLLGRPARRAYRALGGFHRRPADARRVVKAGATLFVGSRLFDAVNTVPG